jgi:hypothetical protein
MHAVFNERTRLLATFLNNVGVATIMTSLIVPAVSLFYAVGSRTPKAGWVLIAGAWFLVGIGL